MDNQTLLLILLGLAAIAVVVLSILLLRAAAHRAAAAVVGEERDRLAQQLQAERDAARTQAAQANQLSGQLGALREELQGRDAAIQRAEAALAEQQRRAEEANVAARDASARLTQSEAGRTALQRQHDALTTELQGAQQRLSVLTREHADATAHLKHAREANAEMRRFLDEAQEKLKGSFAELAGKVFEERGQQFEKNVREVTLQGKDNLDALLKPFSDRLGEFRARVDTLYAEESKERSALVGAVTEMKALNQTMADRADALTRALKGNSRVRGDWGELMLESVLRGSGLEEGKEYEKQVGTRDEDGRALRPDVIVRLPDERLVVIDSKVNLVAWQEAMNSVDEAELHSAALRRHAEGLRQHVRDLAERNYPRALGDKALDVTVAFVPIEGALSAALGADGDLQGFAFERKVVFASPNTLMALLRVVDRLWSRDRSQRRAMQIADVGGKLLDALNAFVGQFKQVGKRIEDAGDAYSTALRRLESSQGVFQRGRRLVELGVRSRKTLADELKMDTSELLELGADESSSEEGEDE